MVMFNKLAVLTLGLAILVGCGAPAEAPVEATKPTETSSTTSAATAEMAKCEACGGEVPKAELAMDHGKMTCKKCVESHGH
jgi:TolA-binding protein